MRTLTHGKAQACASGWHQKRRRQEKAGRHLATSECTKVLLCRAARRTAGRQAQGHSPAPGGAGLSARGQGAKVGGWRQPTMEQTADQGLQPADAPSAPPGGERRPAGCRALQLACDVAADQVAELVDGGIGDAVVDAGAAALARRPGPACSSAPDGARYWPP